MNTEARAQAGMQETGFSSILVPVDGSDASARAIEVALRFRAGRIVLLRVDAGDPIDPDAGEDDIYAQWQREHLGRVQAELDGLARNDAQAAGTVETVVRNGEPAEVIMAEARDHDLLVMSSSGRGAAGRMLFGSVADRVVRHGDSPTLVVRVSDDDIAFAPTERVVVPLDGSQLAEAALPLAARVGAVMQVPVHLVRSVGMDEVMATLREARASGDDAIFASDDPYEVARTRADAEASAYLETMTAQLLERGVEATSERMSGTAVFELLWAVQPSDIVVMTSQGRGGYERWLVGSVAEKMMREAKGPVLLVPVDRSNGTPGGA
jgi:nucleotide-binding universal stress UspA family protein